MKWCALIVAVLVVLSGATAASAQCWDSVVTTTYYQPTTVYYAPAPAPAQTVYYAPAQPTTVYYAAPQPAYYGAPMVGSGITRVGYAPTTVYYAPRTTYYAGYSPWWW